MDKYLFYGKKMIPGVVGALFVGVSTFYFAKYQATKGYTSDWINGHIPQPGSDADMRSKVQQHAWMSVIFSAISDEDKERLTQRWEGKSYKPSEYSPELLAWEKKSRENYLLYTKKNQLIRWIEKILSISPGKSSPTSI